MWKTIAPISTAICWFLAVAALALSVASAEETNKKDKDAVVREVDLKGFTRAKTRGVASKPTKITSAPVELNQQIDIARRLGLVTCHGAEQGQ
jgi:hypothetical protein